MATLVIALGQARVDLPLVNCVAAAADKSEAQTRPRKEADFRLFSTEFDAFSSQRSAPTETSTRAKHTADKETKRFDIRVSPCSSASLPCGSVFSVRVDRREAPAATDVPERLLQRERSVHHLRCQARACLPSLRCAL